MSITYFILSYVMSAYDEYIWASLRYFYFSHDSENAENE